MEHKEYYSESPPRLRVTDPSVSWSIGDEVINGVISAAVWSEKRRPGIWQAMIKALNSGAGKTKEGTVNAFLFRAMVDRLLEEFHSLEADQTD